MSRAVLCAVVPLLLLHAALADEAAFSTGPAIEGYGPAANPPTDFAIPADLVFRHSFDVDKPAKRGKANSSFVAAARFLNMHARAGVKSDRVQLAMIVHGKAVLDLTHTKRYAKETDTPNANAELVAALADEGVRFIVCGQSAAYHDVTAEDLLPGVEMALSAMTAHAVLQHQGYTLNPF
ncbi:MAG: DsrE family protein [Pseudomonadota bacterium]